jgi:hypothetical protein
MKFALRAASFWLSLAILGSTPVQAIVVKSVKITNGIPDVPLQITELIALQAGTGLDVAAAATGATVQASPELQVDFPRATADLAIDGDYSNQSYPHMYHSDDHAPDAYLTVTFDQAYDLSGLTIYGRTDCCDDEVRDVFDYELFDESGVSQGKGTLDASGDLRMASVDLTSAVPEPSSWAVTVAGFGLLGAAMRRRKVPASFA